jgi:uncharacterized RmlC-like cupin family protein
MEKILNYANFNWESPKGFDDGIEQFVVKNTLDEVNKSGVRTRFVRFEAGAKTSVKFLHDYHEEVYLVEGDQILLDAGNLEPKEQYKSGEYFMRPAGTYHGPFTSEKGCVLFEIHYY